MDSEVAEVGLLINNICAPEGGLSRSRYLLGHLSRIYVSCGVDVEAEIKS